MIGEWSQLLGELIKLGQSDAALDARITYWDRRARILEVQAKALIHRNAKRAQRLFTRAAKARAKCEVLKAKAERRQAKREREG